MHFNQFASNAKPFQMQEKTLSDVLKTYQQFLKPVIRLTKTQKLVALDLSNNNKNLTVETMTDVDSFSKYVNQQINSADAAFGIGGYLENRKLYEHSPLFDAQQTHPEARVIHLGVDIWGPVGTPVFTPLGGTIHSFGFNNHKGDYGATIILQHQLEGLVFHTLYGHLSLVDLEYLRPNNYISPGICMAHFGQPAENGMWPPHLHFQIIMDMHNKIGDYPGVCSLSQIDFYKKNCPNPEAVLQMQHFLAEPQRSGT